MKTRETAASLLLALLALATACEESPDAPTETRTNTVTSPEPEPAPPRAVARAPQGGYVAREWGLVRFMAGAREVASSYHGRHVPRVIHKTDRRPRPKKPLIYLTPHPGFDPQTTIEVTVTLTHGVLREVWPTPESGPQPAHTSSFAFGPISLLPGDSCGEDVAPRLEDPACQSLTDGGVCEAAEMAEYIRAVPDCLSVAGVRAPALVYNAYADSLPEPVSIGAERLQNTSAHEVGPIYLRTQGGAYVRIERIAPGEDAAISQAKPIPADPAERRALLREDLLALGMTAPLAGDFLDAWLPDVLADTWSFQALGWYSKAGADTVSTLTFDPEPHALHRALAFSIEPDATPERRTEIRRTPAPPRPERIPKPRPGRRNQKIDIF